MRSTRFLLSLSLCVTFLAGACSTAPAPVSEGDAGPHDGGVPPDGLNDDAGAPDAGAPDAPPSACATDADCDDGNACNGDEVCGDDGVCDAGTPVVCPEGDGCQVFTCSPETGSCVNTALDADDDGSACDVDCNDDDATIAPTGSEIPGDGTDQNCDGLEFCYWDGDHDGFRDPGGFETEELACPTSGGWATAGQPLDCNDLNGAIHTGAFETVGDEIDQDCDGMELCFADGDVDGFTSGATITSADADCSDAGEARLGAGFDCCDSDGRAFPGQSTPFGASDGGIACGGWDFDCNGSETATYTSTSSCIVGSGSVPACMFVRAGWNGSVPGCGGGGSFVTNCTGTGSCTRVTVPREQLCL